MRKLMMVALVALVAAACDEGTGLNGTQVTVDLSIPTVSASVAGAGALARSIDISGSNGVLTLDTAHVILAEFELDPVEDDCDTISGQDDSNSSLCQEFESGPMLINLPLDGGTVTAVSAEADPGQYEEVEFEFEDLDDDEDDPIEQQQVNELREAILAEFDDWPWEASMRLVGSFTPEGGDPQPFVVYVEAEIEVELEFDSPLVITEDDASRIVTIELVPSDWFLLGDGTVMNLAAYDGLVPEFEVEIENGFKSVEHDDD